MAGNKIGAIKTARKNKEKYGADYYASIGSIGGSRKVKKGFGVDKRTKLQKLLRKPKLAAIAGSKGGSISRRGKAHEKVQ